MNKNELKDLVKSYFNLQDKVDIKESEEITKEAFASGELIDGTKVNNGSDKEFEVGDSLFVVTEAGETVDAPSGEHELKDGTVVVVDGAGKITGINKPGETGQGSLSKEEEASEETLAEEKAEESKEEFDNAVVESDELPLAEHGDEEESLEEHGVKEEIIEAIMEVISPKIEEMQKKLAEHEEKMKEHYSSAADTSVTEKAFSKAGFGAKPNGDMFTSPKFDLKKMQYDAILKRSQHKN